MVTAVITRANHGVESTFAGQLGSGKGDPTRPDPTRESLKFPDPTRPVRSQKNFLTRPAGRVVTRDQPWLLSTYSTDTDNKPSRSLRPR